ncbi:MAG: hypothetical protein LBG52_09270 [Candidatus Peribacteria bacterium]|nr:hypothetical protein [Candidatus Peribacteria bacterium]
MKTFNNIFFLSFLFFSGLTFAQSTLPDVETEETTEQTIVCEDTFTLN